MCVCVLARVRTCVCVLIENVTNIVVVEAVTEMVFKFKAQQYCHAL